MDLPIYLTGVLAGGALLILVAEAVSGGKAKKALPGYISLGTILVSIGLIFLTQISPAFSLTTSHSVFRNDLLGVFFSIVVLAVSALVAASSIDYVKTIGNSAAYNSLLLFTALGMVLLAFAADLLMIIVAWELMSLPTYMLTGFRKNDPDSTEASVKYFILGAFSTGVLLYAVSLVYLLAGSTNIATAVLALQELAPEFNPIAILAVSLLVAGFGLKMSVVPFHMWIPDAYEGAPPTVAALLSAATKKAAFAVAVRVFVVALPFFQLEWTTAFAILAVATMTLGNIAALTQKVISRMLAYSSIAQAGYILIGLAVAPYAQSTPIGLIGVLFHSFTHGVMQATAFIAVAAVSLRIAKPSLDSYNGLGLRMPVTAFTLTIALLGLAGVPPLNGFWSKLVLFSAAVEAGNAVWWGGWLALAGILNTGFSLGYYAWVIKRMYLDDPEEAGRLKESFGLTGVLVAAALIIIITGIFPAPIYEFAENASLAISSAATAVAPS
ncbi:MAG: NADH-quinone oxidoreductase subunit N [Thaumarchaeota archaeon]|nr:NADH-quinone oxidoreductase subunit N [Nitrososphaerota archaeon]